MVAACLETCCLSCSPGTLKVGWVALRLCEQAPLLYSSELQTQSLHFTFFERKGKQSHWGSFSHLGDSTESTRAVIASGPRAPVMNENLPRAWGPSAHRMTVPMGHSARHPGHVLSTLQPCLTVSLQSHPPLYLLFPEEAYPPPAPSRKPFPEGTR